jgi:hypothetical protein
MKFAHVHYSGLVGNISFDEQDHSDVADDHRLVEIPDGIEAGIGWTFAPDADPQFIPPQVQPKVRSSWTAYQFLLRFTAEERAAFRAAATTDANVADFQQLAQAAQEVLSDDPMTLAGMDYLVSVALLSSERRAEILGL